VGSEKGIASCQFSHYGDFLAMGGLGSMDTVVLLWKSNFVSTGKEDLSVGQFVTLNQTSGAQNLKFLEKYQVQKAPTRNCE